MFHVEFCEIIAIGRNIVVFASWMTVGMIAFSRSISFNKKSFCRQTHFIFCPWYLGLCSWLIHAILCRFEICKNYTSDFHRSYLNAF